MSLNNQIIDSAKWSAITEIISKLINPISNMILARILAPEAFGVIATVTMIISFADMFTDAGFQKYLIQYEFKNKEEQYKYANVAFWTNLFISIILWAIITLFKDYIAKLVGNPGLGYVISISSIQLIFTAFSSIQIALYRREFDFKTIFLVRITTICIPFIITIPLALMGFGYWSLIIGTMTVQLINAIFMTMKSNWKPKLFYKVSILKEMISFSMWSLIEAVSIWLTVWIDSFIVGMFLNEYYLGLYKTSTSLVNSIMSIVTATTIPVLFSALSRLQENEGEFKSMFYKFQKIVAYLIIPMGIGIFVYRDLVTLILLGQQWREASDIVGIWGLTSAIVIVFSYFNSEVYRAKGKPKISFISQMIHLAFLVPACIISLKYGFWKFIYVRSLARLQGVVVGFIIMSLIMKFPIIDTIKNTVKPIGCSLAMAGLGFMLIHLGNSLIWDITSISICIVFYLLLIFSFGKSDVEFITEKLIYKKFKGARNKSKEEITYE